MNIFDLIEIPAPPRNLAGEEQPLRQGGPPCGSQDVRADRRAGSGMRCRLAARFSFVFFDNANLVTLSNSYSPLLLFIPGSESF